MPSAFTQQLTHATYSHIWICIYEYKYADNSLRDEHPSRHLLHYVCKLVTVHSFQLDDVDLLSNSLAFQIQVQNQTRSVEENISKRPAVGRVWRRLKFHNKNQVWLVWNVWNTVCRKELADSAAVHTRGWAHTTKHTFSSAYHTLWIRQTAARNGHCSRTRRNERTNIYAKNSRSCVLV